MRKLLLLSVFLVSVVGFTACGDSSDSSETSGDTPSGEESSSSGEETVRVYALLPSVQDEAYIRENAGMERQAEKEENAEITIDAGTDRGSAEALISKLESAITQEYDVIAVNPGEVAEQMLPVLETAIDKGIKVIAFDQTVPGLEGLSTYIAWNAAKAGELMGEYWAETLLPDGGEIGVIRCYAGNPLQDSVANGFKEKIAGSGIEIVATSDAQCDPAKGRSATENMLTAHSNLKGIFGDTDLGSQGAVQALKADGLDLIVTGNGGSEATLKEMSEPGSITDATTTFPFEFFGEKAISEAVAVARGEEPQPETVIEPELVTKENAKKVYDEVVAISGGA